MGWDDTGGAAGGEEGAGAQLAVAREAFCLLSWRRVLGEYRMYRDGCVLDLRNEARTMGMLSPPAPRARLAMVAVRAPLPALSGWDVRARELRDGVTIDDLPYRRVATASISTRAPTGSAATPTVARAG